jgi:hypothetical protein
VLLLLQAFLSGDPHRPQSCSSPLRGGRGRVDLTILFKGPDYAGIPTFVDKLDFENLRNKMEKEGEKKDELSRQGERRQDNDYGEQGEKDLHESSQGERQSLPWFDEETIDIFLSERGCMFKCCPKRMEKFLKEAWITLPAEGSGREPSTESARGEESRTLPQFSEDDLGRFLDERAEGGCPELLQLFLSREEEGARQEIGEEGEEWTACMAGAIDDYLPEGMELSHSHEEGTQATPVWESEPHFLRAYSPAGYMPTGKGITSSRGGWLMGRHEERTPQQMEELDMYLTTR